MSLAETVVKLNIASTNNTVTMLENINWQTYLDSKAWIMSEDLLSLYGTSIYNKMGGAQRKRLALLELVNFFSLNIHGEKHLINGIINRLHIKYDPKTNEYLHHFIDEENKHMACFAEFCQRYAGFIYPDRNIQFPTEYVPGEEDFLFFCKALIFEEIVDSINAFMAKDVRLHSVVQQINLYHHRDESRHRAFGRSLVLHIFNSWQASWNSSVKNRIQNYLHSYINQCWKSFYNPEIYQDIGLNNPIEIRELAMNSSHSQMIRKTHSRSLIKFFSENNILSFDSKPVPTRNKELI